MYILSLSIFLVLFVFSTGYSESNMIVKLKNGKKYSYRTYSIDKVYFQKIGSFPFGLTSNKYSESQNLNYACKSEFGDCSRVADWDEIKNFYYKNKSLSSFFNKLSLPRYKTPGWSEIGAFVNRSGEGFYSGNRHYFITRHDGNLPGHYLSHDNINNHELDLGSWRGSGKVLCIKCSQ